MPDQVTQVFIRNYSNHSNRLTEALLSLNIESVQQTLTEFWTSIPIYLYSQMDHNEAAITIGRLIKCTSNIAAAATIVSRKDVVRRRLRKSA